MAVAQDQCSYCHQRMIAAWVPAHQTAVSGIRQCSEEEEDPKQHPATTGSEVVAWVQEEALGQTVLEDT